MLELLILKIFIFCLGAVVGSFLNVCIYRLPLNESIIRPASHCPHCKHAIGWYDNIPILLQSFRGANKVFVISYNTSNYHGN